MKNEIKYKIESMFYDGEVKYHIMRKKEKGKWRLVYGNMTYEKANSDLNDPELIESKRKFFIITKWAIMFVLLIGIAYLIFIK